MKLMIDTTFFASLFINDMREVALLDVFGEQRLYSLAYQPQTLVTLVNEDVPPRQQLPSCVDSPTYKANNVVVERDKG